MSTKSLEDHRVSGLAGGTMVSRVHRVLQVQHVVHAVVNGGSIASALSAAQDGDIVHVSEGVYQNTSQQPTLSVNKIVCLQAVGGEVEIRPFQNSPVFHVAGPGAHLTCKGVTLRRVQPASNTASHGVRVESAQLTLKNCKFLGMQAIKGTAIYATGASTVIADSCVFDGNQRFLTDPSAVVWLEHGNGKPTGSFVDCVFQNNYARACHVAYSASDPLQEFDPPLSFEGCVFRNNEVLDYVVGVHNSLRSTDFLNCSFVDNRIGPSFAGDAQSAIHCDNAKVWLGNCTIARNAIALGPGWPVGAVGIKDSGTSPVTIEAAIIAFNEGPAVFKMFGNQTLPSNVTVGRSVLFGNEAGTHRTDADWISLGDDVVNECPAFCDTAAGDYRLYAHSPAAPGALFEALAGALGIGCVPDAVIALSRQDYPFSYGPSNLIVACPAGDATKLGLSIDLGPDAAITRSVQSAELLLDPTSLTAKVFDADGEVRATGVAELANQFTTNIVHGSFGARGTSSAKVMLNGTHLAPSVLVEVRTPDFVASSGGVFHGRHGKVDLNDYADFGTHFYAPYNAAYDLVPDGVINSLDFGWFGAHYNHETPDGQLNETFSRPPVASAEIELSFTEEYVTATSRRLYVDVDFNNIADVTTSVFSIRAGDSRLSLLDWEPSDETPGIVLFTPVTRGGEPEMFFGVSIAESFNGSSARLGRLVLNMSHSEPLEVDEEMFLLTVGDVLVQNHGGTSYGAEMKGAVGRKLNTQAARILHDRLEQNFPNPFNPTTTLAFSLKSAGNVTLTVFDVAGRRVRELVNERLDRGAYRTVWDGRNDAGSTVASGVYFYKLVAGTFTDTKKMTILK